MSRNQKKMLIRIFSSAILLIGFAVIEHFVTLQWYITLSLFLLPYFIIGYDVLKEAAENIIQGQVFDENFLMALATVGALATQQYEEAVFVMLFYQVGEFFKAGQWAKAESPFQI